MKNFTKNIKAKIDNGKLDNSMKILEGFAMGIFSIIEKLEQEEKTIKEKLAYQKGIIIKIDAIAENPNIADIEKLINDHLNNSEKKN